MADFLNDVKRVGGDLARWGKKSVDNIANAVDTHSEISRLSGKMKRLNEQRDAALAEIGKKVFALYGRGKVANAEIIAECEKVEALAAEVTKLREQMDTVRHGSPSIDIPIKDETPLERSAPAPPQPTSTVVVVPPEPPVPSEPPAPPEPPVPPAPPVPPEAPAPPETSADVPGDFLDDMEDSTPADDGLMPPTSDASSPESGDSTGSAPRTLDEDPADA